MNWLSLIIKFFPVVLQTVIAVENALHGQPGATKKAVVMDIITAGAKQAQTIPNDTVQDIGTLVDNVVGALNSSKVFNKLGAPPTTAPTAGGMVSVPK
jgi:hypothetical protein